MDQCGPEAALKGKIDEEPSMSFGRKEKATLKGNAKPKNSGKVKADAKMAEAAAKMEDPEDHDSGRVLEKIDEKRNRAWHR